MKIYVIQGSTGEYSDHTEWIVCAFKEKEKAKSFVIQLTEEAYIFMKERDPKAKTSPPNDPRFVCDYTGFNYIFFEAELRE